MEKINVVRVDDLENIYFELKVRFFELMKMVTVEKNEDKVAIIEMIDANCCIYFTDFEFNYSKITNELFIRLMFSNKLMAELTVEKGCVFKFNFEEGSIIFKVKES